MIRMFDAFRRWCAENNVPADQIEITVKPLSASVAAKFEAAWHNETRLLTMRPADSQMPTAGHIYSVPFRYERPAMPVPFGGAG